jgi:hypothetical protein
MQTLEHLVGAAVAAVAVAEQFQVLQNPALVVAVAAVLLVALAAVVAV